MDNVHSVVHVLYVIICQIYLSSIYTFKIPQYFWNSEKK